MLIVQVVLAMLIVLAGCWILNAGFPVFLWIVGPLGIWIENLSVWAGNVFFLLTLFLYIGLIVGLTAAAVVWVLPG